ncbi:Hemolysin-type calcium-binding region [Gluconacetobacter diazotrophicus PA1 5]|uniref:hypothetical protein n=1 Tax=Gluconacetobacter diazotrophicus TaxID=33996 RepID=UPI000173CCFE|nr:hypothetical protein [Gluconacetobacter diazotrophicus]ACI51222.1 Hemolysin-type calcium-binding region [Gluconacetobacter diazotrophicus PA1 5]
MVTAVYNETSDFSTSDTDIQLTGDIGLTQVDANGYNGLITLTENQYTPGSGDVDLGGYRYWMGSLWLGGITTPSSTQEVAIYITTDYTDVGLFEYSPGAGSAANVIYFGGVSDSLSMSDYASAGQTMDLSGTTFEQWNSSTGVWDNENVHVNIHGSDGNDIFTGSNQINYLYEGTGNDIFYQSAGDDIITTEGGNDIYYASDALSDYEGGYEDTNGNSYMNDGSNWLLQDTANGKFIELTDVSSVNIGGVTYSSSVENSAPAWTNDDTTSSAASTDASSALASIANGAGLHASMLADSAVIALNNASGSTSAATTSPGPSSDLSYSGGSLATMLGTHDTVAAGVLTDDKSANTVVAS